MRYCFGFRVTQLVLRTVGLGLVPLFVTNGVTAAGSDVRMIEIDGRTEGRVFEGIGALSAGASSRLLIDYPEPERSAILDFLFKPNFGAGLQDLKVEIGGDVNSTDGSEPSHARTKAELTHPKPEYYQRGYEWWLMSEAVKRNPEITLGSLQWGAPGWIGGGVFTSQDNADFITAFIKAARDYHNLKIEHQGLWNEIDKGYSVPWIKTLRKTLDANGLTDVKLVVADLVGVYGWGVADSISKDPELRKAIYAIGTHYPGFMSTDEAIKLGIPLWSSEDGPWRGDWQGAMSLAMRYNRNYILGKMTKTIIWSPISAYYDNRLLPGSGLMKANTPWSGYYDVQPAIWATAHTTQFTQPGWVYVDSGCGLLDKLGSYVTLKRPGSADFSIIVETMDAPDDAKARYPVKFKISGGLAAGNLHVWRTNEKEQFVELADITSSDGSFNVDLEGRAIYSFTTTTGQSKGISRIPKSKPFPMPYREDFENYTAGKTPRYLSDQNGTFEIVGRMDGHGKCLRQVSPSKSIEWGIFMEYPWTEIGDTGWDNYEVSCDVLIEKTGKAGIIGRIADAAFADKVPNGFRLMVDADGQWKLSGLNAEKSGKVPFSPGTWHNLKMTFEGPVGTAYIDNVRVAALHDCELLHGMVGLASDYNYVCFDNLDIRPLNNRHRTAVAACVNLTAGKTATASSIWSGDYTADKANDGDLNTRWNPKEGTSSGEWLQIDFGVPTTFNKTITQQLADRVMAYKVQYWDGSEWKDAFTGGKMGPSRRTDTFPPVTSNKIRLLIVSTEGNETPSIYDFQVHNCSQPSEAVK